MNEKTRCFALILLVLLLVPVLGISHHAVSEISPEVGIVERDYYFIAGYNVTPQSWPGPIPPRQTNPNFTFTFTASQPANPVHNPYGYNMSSIYPDVGGDWLFEGCLEAAHIDVNAYVEVNITNLLGYDITLLDLTAEVSDGTPMRHWDLKYPETWMGNMTMVAVDTLDPWDPDYGSPIDEVNYNTGVVDVHRDMHGSVGPRVCPDWWRKATGAQGYPYPWKPLGPGSLLEDDLEGDAGTTSHVKHVSLTNGSTFTEYFGLIVFGYVPVDTLIDATITLRLKYNPPEPSTETCEIRITNVLPLFPCHTWDALYVSFEMRALPINITLKNWGTLPISSITVNAYWKSLNRSMSWTLIDSSTIGSLSASNETMVTIYWDLKSTVRTGYSAIAEWLWIKVNATATCDVLTDTNEYVPFRVKATLIGDANGDHKVDVLDERYQALAMFEQHPEPYYIFTNQIQDRGDDWRPLYTDTDGNYRVDVIDQRLQIIHLFEIDIPRW